MQGGREAGGQVENEDVCMTADMAPSSQPAPEPGLSPHSSSSFFAESSMGPRQMFPAKWVGGTSSKSGAGTVPINLYR